MPQPARRGREPLINCSALLTRDSSPKADPTRPGLSDQGPALRPSGRGAGQGTLVAKGSQEGRGPTPMASAVGSDRAATAPSRLGKHACVKVMAPGMPHRSPLEQVLKPRALNLSWVEIAACDLRF